MDMKIVFKIMLIYMISFSTAKAQSTTVEQQKNIAAFIQVWGLLKYHHPASVIGGFDADQVFMANVETLTKSDATAFNNQLLQLIIALNQSPVLAKLTDQVPSQQSTSVVVQRDQLRKNINLSWLHKRIYSDEVQQQLIQISAVRNWSGKHFYIPSLHYTADLPNERAYPDYRFDRPAFNLLALAKAWNAIAYLFPYKYVIGKDWNTVLQEMIPAFMTIRNRADYERAILLLEVAINDSHAEGFVDQMKDKSAVLKLRYYPPFDYQVYDQKILIKAFLNDSLARGSRLLKGDLIVRINGVKVEKMLADRYHWHPASNIAVKNRSLSMDIEGNAYFFADLDSRSLQVQVFRNGKFITLPLELLDGGNAKDMAAANLYVRTKIKRQETIKGYEELNEETVLFRAGHFFDKDLPKGEEQLAVFSSRLKTKKAIIFDMRGYPEAPGLFYYFIPQALGISAFNFARYYAADLSYPGAFNYLSGVEHYLSKDITKNPVPYRGKIVILTDENTQSMGEWYTLMLSQLNKNTVIIGSQTAGADGDLKRLNLPGGYSFVFTGNGIFYPDGRETQRIGIKPDRVFRPSAADLVFKENALLEEAMQSIGE